MKAIVQRVRGRTSIASRTESQEEYHFFEGVGLVVLLGWTREDEARPDLDQAEEWIVSRVRGLRIFPDREGRMNLSLADAVSGASVKGGKGGILWVPQFTLAATLESGFRPSFSRAMTPEVARGRFEKLAERLRASDFPYAQCFGSFGADMELGFTNWGPVTIPLEA